MECLDRAPVTNARFSVTELLLAVVMSSLHHRLWNHFEIVKKQGLSHGDPYESGLGQGVALAGCHPGGRRGETNIKTFFESGKKPSRDRYKFAHYPRYETVLKSSKLQGLRHGDPRGSVPGQAVGLAHPGGR